MKLKLAAAALCAAGIAMPAAAGDADDIKALVAKAEKSYNTCDAETLQSLRHAQAFDFNPDGTLTEGNEGAELKAACDAGTKFDYKFSVQKVDVRGDMAIVAATNKGTVTPKDGEAQNLEGHFTVVMVKDGDGWKAVHVHSSPNISAEE